MRRVAKVFLACLVAAGCAQARGPLSTPVQEEAGAAFVYLSPFPPEASRLSFRFQEISVLREDGAAVPLPLLLHDDAGAEPGRERRLAGGDLPPGRYSALAIRVTAPPLPGGEGPGDLPPIDFHEIIALIALYRPGPMNMLDDYVQRRHRLAARYDELLAGLPVTIRILRGILKVEPGGRLWLGDCVVGDSVEGVVTLENTGGAPLSLQVAGAFRRCF